MFKIAIVGSRNWRDWDKFKVCIEQIFDEWGVDKPDMIISGGASGVDAMAERFAWVKYDMVPVVFKADWNKHGTKAGPIRNSLIVKECTHVIAFPSRKGKGTQDTIKKAISSGKVVKKFFVEDL